MALRKFRIVVRRVSSIEAEVEIDDTSPKYLETLDQSDGDVDCALTDALFATNWETNEEEIEEEEIVSRVEIK